MSRAVGEKKPQEAQKAKAFWKVKAAKDAGEEYCGPTRDDNIRGRNETRFALWEEHLTDPTVALDRAEVCGKTVLEVSARVVGGCLAMAGVGFLQGLWEKQIREGVWP